MFFNNYVSPFDVHLSSTFLNECRGQGILGRKPTPLVKGAPPPPPPNCTRGLSSTSVPSPFAVPNPFSSVMPHLVCPPYLKHPCPPVRPFPHRYHYLFPFTREVFPAVPGAFDGGYRLFSFSDRSSPLLPPLAL